MRVLIQNFKLTNKRAYHSFDVLPLELYSSPIFGFSVPFLLWSLQMLVKCVPSCKIVAVMGILPSTVTLHNF